MISTTRLAARNLTRYRRRTLLTALLIMLGVTALLIFLAAAGSFKQTMIGSITGGTLTTCVVFIPLLMLNGMSGQLFTQLGYTIIFCMTASLFSAVIIVPLCYMF